MIDEQQLATWEEAAHPREDHPGLMPHRQSGALMPTPAGRVLELTREANRLRGYLGEACAGLRAAQTTGIPQDGPGRWLTTMKDTSFAGVAMAQLWVDLYLWEAVLNENPTLGGIIEIGTWKGGLSLWLHAQAQARGMDFVTYDAVDPGRVIPGFRRIDVFAHPEAVRDDVFRIEEYRGAALVFCDGGNKPRELRTFAPMLTDARSLVAVHDWGTETNPDDVPDDLVMLYVDVCEQLGSITRWFRRKP